ncbi:MAG: DEAD/DEAH box helicase family protein [Alphaproteobacteria bacterium]|nr:DEAD/DEAH box helicase family protein [Alphaproteobacteria bacterium]
MARKSADKKRMLDLPFKQVLNQWIIAQFGFDPLASIKKGKKKLRALEPFAATLRSVPEGLTADNLHHFYKALDIHLQDKAAITRADLMRYEQNIVSHTLAINERRARPIVWKYYQWLSLLFAEVYLDRFFASRESLMASLNGYVDEFNAFWQEKGFETGITPFTYDELNKICLQNATGSGKTLLMHVNFLQFRHYANQSSFRHDLTRTILITPNEGLSVQHAREFKDSGIAAGRLLTDTGDLLSTGKNGLRQIDYTEITKLGDVDSVNVIATRNLGDQNLLLVDEAHRGMGSKEETGWFKSRERLVERGFVFEYSATFKEAVIAAKRPEIEEAYAKSIIFDYSYRYFYEDGYGKDYRIFNLPKTYNQLRFSYLTACLLSFYQQLKLYEDKKTAYLPYNLEKPLWVFVGSTVTGAKSDKETMGDVAQILSFIAGFLGNESLSISEIEKLLSRNGHDTGLIDDKGGDIFAGSFLYLQELVRREKWKVQDLFRDILGKIFQNRAGGQLMLARIKGDQNEILLRIGQEEIPFGLINVGDAPALIKHIEDAGITDLVVHESEFSEKLFAQVHLSSSPVTMLIGSKKFVEGWDCWRVSTLGLMHVGKSEGSQIIQLFGRGVRLKGHSWSLKRSGFATPTHQPEHVQFMETLNVFGIEADFMEKFKKFLEEEDLPSNDHKFVETIPLTVTYDFGKQLKVLRPREKRGDGREYDFKKDGRVPAFGDVPEKLASKSIEVDWYPRIQSIASKSSGREAGKEKAIFSTYHLSFLDFDDLFFRIEKFKRERSWYNINISLSAIRPLLENPSWYTLTVPAGRMDTADILNVSLWQEMACELLQKYCEEYYNYCKAEFIQPRLELRAIQPKDQNLPPEEEYQLVVDSNENALIEDIIKLKEEIAAKKQGILKINGLKSCMFSNHLYQPLIHVAKGSKIQIAPVSLNESEFQFVEDLREYLMLHEAQFLKDGTEVFLLRNESRGRGMGFFEAGNFYPDFLLWQLNDKKQKIAFIEPHGLQHEGPGHKKIKFYTIIKDIERRLADPDVTLNSFIVTPTRFAKLNWDKAMSEFADIHVLFMEDQKDIYIHEIMKRMSV